MIRAIRPAWVDPALYQYTYLCIMCQNKTAVSGARSDTTILTILNHKQQTVQISSVLLHRHAPVLFDGPKRVVGDLPRMAVRVGKISGVSAPEGFLRLL